MTAKENQQIIGVDLGGTKVRAGRTLADEVLESQRGLIPAQGSVDEVINTICKVIDGVNNQDVAAIGIGVPSVVDVESGVVYDVQNIPSWKVVPLKDILENKYGIPVSINNDVNCFALGENYYGLGKQCDHFVTLIIGTGIAAGIIINNRIYNGRNCGAGEIGMIPYLDHHYEYYCSGQFFENIHQTNGEEQYQLAISGDPQARKLFSELGSHIGHAIKTVLYTFDPDMIILGGSVVKAHHLFAESMMQTIQTFAYRSVLDNLIIKQSNNEDIALLGAAALHLNSIQQYHTQENIG